ncbi:MAG: alpha/beta hydrolase [Phaeodactylibacter sp.]|nr:alpha/beta hydrolase [Phaeodactylibacter sp.]
MKNQLFFAVALVVLSLGCSKSEFLSEGYYFHLENKGAKMPIWVKGNLESDVFLITVHGGPGDSGHEFPLSRGFELLEEDYAIVYWDQRLSGLSQGDPDKYDLTPELFIEDTEKVVELIRHKFNPKSMFMLGHSWGGQLSAGYLGRDGHADLFNGWIDLDGSIYGDLEVELMREWLLERVPEKLEEPGADVAFWQFILDWYEEHPAPTNYTDIEPYLYVGSLEGYAYDWAKTQEENPTPYKELIFSSMFSFAFYVEGLPADQTWADNINFTPELENMTLPALLLWGETDGAVPVGVGQYVYDHLATDPSQKEFIVLEECAHSPHYDQPERFYALVREFMETYK